MTRIIANAEFLSVGSPLDVFRDKAEHLLEESALGYGRRGGARYDQGRVDEAIADFEAALKLDPTVSALWLQKALAHRKQGNLTDARKAYAAAADLIEQDNPEFAMKLRNGLQSITKLQEKKIGRHR